jgi:hypothetical protein
VAAIQPQAPRLTLLLCCAVLRQAALLSSMAEAGDDNFVHGPCYFLNLVTSTGRQTKEIPIIDRITSTGICPLLEIFILYLLPYL